MKIIIATRNEDKGKELKSLLNEYGIDVQLLSDFDPDGTISDIEETGETLQENAFLKAKTIFSITGIPAIADDTGLEVDALDCQPGVYSARYAGDNCTYEDNVNKLLFEMKGVPTKLRTARFKTVVCYTDNEKELCKEGVVEGFISEKPSGNNGFGYDPVFCVKELNKTYAELSDEEKNENSHRAKAIQNFAKCFLSNKNLAFELSQN
tara:strand:- start:16940 stop:17563 length:624 start_codon:yes stop_codon:yes gene_type:complete